MSRKKGFFILTFATLSGAILMGMSSVASNHIKSYNDLAQGGGMMNHGGMSMDSMDLGPADASYDLRFIDAMIMHHQGAIDMANEALQKSKRPEIQQLAKNIIAAQNQEIAQMKQWRQDWYANVGNTPMAWSSQMNHMMPMGSEMKKSMMMSMDLGAGDDKFDLRFIDAMIPHHEGALVMANDALKKSSRPEVKKLAENILSSQKAEIEEMKKWRQEWYK